jgi:outer membrane biogenesis lipoprotein LolB
MSKSRSRLLFSAVAVAVLAGCQQSPPAEEATEEPAESMVEESFESGDTGELKSTTDEPADSAEAAEDDSD